VNYLSRFMQEPSQNHFVAAKRVLRYLRGTAGFGIHFVKSSSINLVGFSDSDWGGSDEYFRLLFCCGKECVLLEFKETIGGGSFYSRG
jgi:hypothetical protein